MLGDPMSLNLFKLSLYFILFSCPLGVFLLPFNLSVLLVYLPNHLRSTVYIIFHPTIMYTLHTIKYLFFLLVPDFKEKVLFPTFV